MFFYCKSHSDDLANTNELETFVQGHAGKDPFLDGPWLESVGDIL